jgi:hypothetical protein
MQQGAEKEAAVAAVVTAAVAEKEAEKEVEKDAAVAAVVAEKKAAVAALVAEKEVEKKAAVAAVVAGKEAAIASAVATAVLEQEAKHMLLEQQLQHAQQEQAQQEQAQQEQAQKKEGFLEKKGHLVKSWKWRYFVWTPANNMIRYYSGNAPNWTEKGVFMRIKLFFDEVAHVPSHHCVFQAHSKSVGCLTSPIGQGPAQTESM